MLTDGFSRSAIETIVKSYRSGTVGIFAVSALLAVWLLLTRLGLLFLLRTASVTVDPQARTVTYCWGLPMTVSCRVRPADDFDRIEVTAGFRRGWHYYVRLRGSRGKPVLLPWCDWPKEEAFSTAESIGRALGLPVNDRTGEGRA
jgi:hypothetical protein